MLYIGIDLGTSAVKLLLVDEKGIVIRTVRKEYPLYFPQSGWSEQNPDDWWAGTVEGLRELMEEVDTHEVRAIGCSGQMHGLVLLDENDTVIRPCILWNDSRAFEEVNFLNHVVGSEHLSELTANIAFAGFTAPKILWVKKNEPANFERIRKIMLPKDYINYRLTGAHCCDYSDASGMLLLDVKNKCWSDEMCNICSVNRQWLPQLHESHELIGQVNNKTVHFLNGVKVVAGAGDNAAAAIGTNTIANGACNISLGTSGTIFIANDEFSVDSNNALHSFAHASGKYHLMGCMLSAASCNKWFCENILKNDNYRELQSDIDDCALGQNAVYFLPYLMGERSPINDVDARACFIGMDMSTTQSDMILAVFEGVAFAIRDSLEVAKRLGIDIKRSNLCGGGAKSDLWKRIICNVLNLEIDIPAAEEGPGYGGAILAMVGDCRYQSVAECAEKLFSVRERIKPEKHIVEAYERKYQTFRALYPALRSIFKEMQKEE